MKKLHSTLSRPGKIGIRRVTLLVIAIALTVFLSQPAGAASLYWDTSGTGTDSSYGGTGTWNMNTTANWNTSAVIGSGALQNWTGTSGDSALFLRGTSGTVTVSGLVSVNSAGSVGLQFGTSAGSFTTGSASYVVNSGTLDIRANTNGTVISNINGSTTTINSTVILFGAGGGLNQIISNTSGTLALNTILEGAAGTHTIIMSGGTNSLISIGNITRSTGSLRLTVGQTTDANSAQYVLSGSNLFSFSPVNFNRGTLTLNNTNALRGINGVTIANANTGTGTNADTAQLLIGEAGVTINSAVTISDIAAGDTQDVRVIGGSNTSGLATFTGSITLGEFASSGVGSSLQVTAAGSGTTRFSGVIDDGVNTSGITKVGDGTVEFTSTVGNTYHGTTTVSAGTLLINNTNGSGTGSGAVVVNGGILSGTGSISGDVTVNTGGTLSPGASIESLGAGGITINNGGTFLYELNTTSVAADLLFATDLSTSLTLTGSPTLSLVDLGANAPLTNGTKFTLFSYTAGSWNGGTFASYADDSTFTLFGNMWQINYDDASAGSNFFADATSFGTSFVTITVVPEPSSFALAACLGGLGLIASWRRHSVRRKA